MDCATCSSVLYNGIICGVCKQLKCGIRNRRACRVYAGHSHGVYNSFYTKESTLICTKMSTMGAQRALWLPLSALSLQWTAYTGQHNRVHCNTLYTPWYKPL
eukprot:4815713-Lingulodinium_polyedra.AAC.1